MNTHHIIQAMFLAFCLLITSHSVNGQTVESYIDDNTPNSRYTLNGDGTATDNTTGLQWMRCTLGQTFNSNEASCTGTAITYNWQQALTQANTHNLAQQGDWRLPNIKELQSLVATNRGIPAINLEVFPSTAFGCYWSSSAYAGNGYSAWCVFFIGGNTLDSYNGNSAFVRLVRNGQ